MRVHPIDEENARLVSIIRDYGAADVSPEWSMTIADTELSHRINSAELGITADSPSWAMTAEIYGRIDIKLTNAPVMVSAVFEDIQLPILNAKYSLPNPSDTIFVTTLIATTPGGLLDKISLRQRTEYNSMTPERIIRDAVLRNPLYDPSQVQIQQFSGALLNRVGSDGFEDEATLMSVLDSVKEEVGCVYYDTAMGGFRAIKDVGFGEGQSVSWVYDTDSAEVIEWKEPTWATPDEQYTSVIVRDPLPEGVGGGMGPGGQYRIWVEKPVNYFWMDFPPADGLVYWVSFTGETGTTLAYDEAQRICFEEARKLGSGLFLGETVVAFNPLLEPTDVVVFTEIAESDAGFFRRVWRCVIEEINHMYGEAASTTLVYRATLVAEQQLPAPEVGETGASPEIVTAIPYGDDEIGEYVVPDSIELGSWYGTEIINGEEVDWFDPTVVGQEFIGYDPAFADFITF